MQGTEAPATTGLRGVERVAQPVVVLVRLARGLGLDDGVAVHPTEAPGAVGVHVELGFALGHPLGEAPAQAAGAAEAVQRQAGGDPEAADARHGPEQGVAVGRHRVWMAEQANHAGLLEHREPSDRPLEQRREAIHVRFDGAGAVVPRDPVGPACGGVRFIPADQQPSGLGLPVDEVVGVAEAGRVARDLMAGHRLHGHVLMVDRNRREERPHHRRDLRRPDPRRVDDVLGLDTTLVGDDRLDRPVGAELDPGDARADPDLHAERTSRIGHRVGGDVRIDPPVVRHPDAAEDRGAVRLGQPREDLVGRDELRLEARPGGLARRPPQVEPARLAGGDPHAPDGLEHLQLAVEGDAVAPQAHHGARRVELGHEPRCVVRRAAGQLALLDQQDVLPPRPGEVERDAATGDPAADDHDLLAHEECFHEGGRSVSPVYSYQVFAEEGALQRIEARS